MPVRAVLFSYFEIDDLVRLMDAIDASDMPAGTRIHVGTYGVNFEASALIREYRGGRFSPMFKAESRTQAWERRRLTREEERRVGRRFRGRVPDLPELLRLSAAQRIGWGVEVGRRYRDTIRRARRAGVVVDSWQFDELGTELAGPQGRQHRQFVRGELQGLTFGRKVLGDRELKGWVWATRAALRLASLPCRPGADGLLAPAQARLVPPGRRGVPGLRRRSGPAARTWSDGQRALAAGGPTRRALAERYVAGMTPGYRIGHGYGGNVRGLSRAEVNRWRNAYIAERARQGVAGFGEYHFVFENSRTTVMRDAARAVARGMSL